jgi:hypothetical protein
MQRTPSPLARVPWSALMLLVGAVLLTVAFVQAAAIPSLAHGDFGELIVSVGGSMSHSATYPDTYRQIAAQGRMLQNAYLGLTGLVLVTVGAIGVTGVGARGRIEG